MSFDEYDTFDGLGLAALVARGEVSPVDLVEAAIARIEKLDPNLNAYLTLTNDEAMQSARAAEDAVMRGDKLGPLHGVPIAIKDLEMTKGVRSTGGSLIYKNRVPDEDSIVVERVKKSGAIILGKTNTPEFGLLGETRNRLGDHCRNPWNTERTSGGSSGGSGAAIIAGLCSVATGSDGGGSIRIPASFCGIYGIKPPQGRVPRYAGAGAPALANITSQSGPMSRTVLDSAILLQVLAGYDPRDQASLRESPPDFVSAVRRDITGLKIGWTSDFGYAAVDSEVVEVAAKAAHIFEELGCTVEDANFQLKSPFDAFWTIFNTIFEESFGPNGLLLNHIGTSILRLFISAFFALIAGTIVGFLGTGFLVLFAWLMWMGVTIGVKTVKTRELALEARDVIEEYYTENAAYPDGIEGNKLIAGMVDAWDNDLRYDADDDSYLIRSASHDGDMDTDDDILVNSSDVSFDLGKLDIDVDDPDLGIEFGDGDAGGIQDGGDGDN